MSATQSQASPAPDAVTPVAIAPTAIVPASLAPAALVLRVEALLLYMRSGRGLQQWTGGFNMLSISYQLTVLKDNAECPKIKFSVKQTQPDALLIPA